MAESNGNGSKWTPSFRPPSEVTPFVIGGQTIEVPALTLWSMEIVKDELLALGPDLDFITYARNVVRIVYKVTKINHPDIEWEESDLIKSCSVGEMKNLATQMNILLGISGFDGGPTQPTEEANLPSGTGTLSGLSPDSPATESVTATST